MIVINKYFIIFIAILLASLLGFKWFSNSTKNTNSSSPIINNSCNLIKNTADAKKIVESYPEVKTFIKSMVAAKQPFIVDAELNKNNWVIQVAENHTDNTATFNWYTLDRCGELKCSFSNYNKSGKYLGAGKYPCN